MTAHAALGDLELPALIADAEAFLSSTKPMYEDVLSWWMRRVTGLKLSPNGAERHDLLYALTLPGLEGLFPRGESIIALAGQLNQFGLAPLAEGRIRVDAGQRPAKSPFPRTVPIDPPSEVVALSRARRGYADTRDFLFSLGAAQHFAHVDSARPFEDRVLGDQAVPLAIGGLFSQWLLDKGWLKRVLDAEWPHLIRILGLAELSRLRWAAAVFLHSVRVDREGPSLALARHYGERLSEATLVAWPEGLSLYETDVRPGGADTLRARMLAVAWSDHLRNRFDEDWWRNPQSGPYLRMSFAQGQQESATVLAERLGLGALSLDRVGKWLEGLLDLRRT